MLYIIIFRGHIPLFFVSSLRSHLELRYASFKHEQFTLWWGMLPLPLRPQATTPFARFARLGVVSDAVRC